MANGVIEKGEWFYIHLGYGGSTSTYFAAVKPTGRMDGGYMCLSDAFSGKELKTKQMTTEWEAISINGSVCHISANQFKANGHIGIGTVEETKDFRPFIYREDGKRLLDVGYTEDEITAEFGNGWTVDEESEEYRPADVKNLTDKAQEMLFAIKAKKEQEEQEKKQKAAEEFAKAKAECEKKYSYIPCHKTETHQYLTVGETSRNLRAILKKEFPGVSFRVRSSSYSGGDSVTVSYENGPAYTDVERIVDRFGSSVHNYAEDYWDSICTAFHSVCGDFSHTFTERRVDSAIENRIVELLVAHGRNDDRNEGYNSNIARDVNEIVRRTTFDGREIVDVVYIDEKDGEYYGKYDVVFAAKPCGGDDNTGKQIVGEGVTVTENTEKNGIEIRFDTIPSVEVRNELKANGWRWSRFAGCWYNRATDDNREFAKNLSVHAEKTAA